jgi:DNA-binding NarL/FixJ family response regulator
MTGIPAKILIVDAHPVYSDKMEGFLRGLTYENIDMAKTGQEALAKLHSLDPDLVIMSAMLPDMDAFDLCRKIKERTPRAKIITQIGLFSGPDDVARFNQNGADIVLIRKEKDLNPLQAALTALCPFLV